MTYTKGLLNGMTLVRGYPPNYKLIVAAFPAVKKHTPIFCYGKTIYYTHTSETDEAKIVHESVHSQRQGDNPDGWWNRYIDDEQFRFFEEMIAHRAEFAYFKNRGRNVRRFQLHQIAKNLSGPLYGRMISRSAAQGWLTHEFDGQSTETPRGLELAGAELGPVMVDDPNAELAA